jgi:hypothetical protein
MPNLKGGKKYKSSKTIVEEEVMFNELLHNNKSHIMYNISDQY